MSLPSLVIIGANGQLGSQLVAQCRAAYDVIALDRAALNLATTDTKKLGSMLRATEPVAILNAAAYTAVDKAEAEPALAHRINAEMPAAIAAIAKGEGVKLLHFSTDYVFDGAFGHPYTEDAPTRPLSAYGASKLAGEEAVLAEGGHVFRLQWVYGGPGQNFFNTMQRLLFERAELRVVADQLGAPSYAPHIAQACYRALPKILSGEITPGVYHLTAGGYTSWHGFACAIAAALRAPARVVPITTAEYPLPATRPQDARLDTSRLAAYGIAMPHWREGLAAHITATGKIA